MGSEAPDRPDSTASPDARLDSWKEIASYLNRHITTVRRWERREGLPVHRHVHDRAGSVYAYRSELDRWLRGRTLSGEASREAASAVRHIAHGTGGRWMRPTRHGIIRAGGIALCLVLVSAAAMLLRGSLTERAPRIGALPLERERNGMPSTPGVSAAARQEYLIGRYHLWRDSEEHLARAVAHFTRAVELEPRYAAAHASLAHAWWKRGLWGNVLRSTERPARRAAREALRLNNRLPEAYVVLADLARLYDHDLDGAEELVTRALSLDPDSVDAHYTYALLLMTVGRFHDAIRHMETAERLDPLSPAVQSDLGRILYRAGRYEDAIVRLRRALVFEPAIGWLVHFRLADAYEELHEYDRALAALELAGPPDHPAVLASRIRILARMGRRGEARRLLAILERETGGDDPSEPLASAYAWLGDHDRAFSRLFDLVERPRPGPSFFAVDPRFRILHSDPRWDVLVRRMNARFKLTGRSS